MAKYNYSLIYSGDRVRARLANKDGKAIFESLESDSLDSKLIFEDGFINHKLDIMTLAAHLKEIGLLEAGDLIDFPECNVNWTVEY